MNSTQLHPKNARDREILTLLVQGLPVKQIAEKVQVTPKSVYDRLTIYKDKAGVQTDTGLVGKILEAKWAAKAKGRRSAA